MEVPRRLQASSTATDATKTSSTSDRGRVPHLIGSLSLQRSHESGLAALGPRGRLSTLLALRGDVLEEAVERADPQDRRTDTHPQVMEAAQRQSQLKDPDSARAGAYTANIAATGDRSIAALTSTAGAHRRQLSL